MATDPRVKQISVARDFSPYPAGRTAKDNEFNGTSFREMHLVPALKSSDHVIVSFDDVYALGSSFLEESFGGLVRLDGFDGDDLMNRLEIVTGDPDLKDYTVLSYEFIKAAQQH